jgi:hypothetical protein
VWGVFGGISDLDTGESTHPFCPLMIFRQFISVHPRMYHWMVQLVSNNTSLAFTLDQRFAFAVGTAACDLLNYRS